MSIQDHPAHKYFAEEISRLVPNPKCKVCGGSRGWSGFREIKGEKHLLVCCGEPGPTEHTRLMTAILQTLPQALDEMMSAHSSLVFRGTFWGGLYYFFGYVLRIVPALRWVRGKFKRTEKAPAAAAGPPSNA